MTPGYNSHIQPVRMLFRREFRLLASVLIIVTSAWAFLLIADAVQEGEIQRFDNAVLLSLRHAGHEEIPRGPAWLAEVMRDITALGGGPVITLVTLGVAGLLVLQKQSRALLLLLGATVGGIVLEIALKHLYERGRPNIVPHLMTADSLSFPSGHSMMSMVVYLTLAALVAPLLPDRRTRVYVVALALILSLLIGISRIYLGVHYPSDVLGGWSIGLAWSLACSVAAWSLERRDIPAQVTHIEERNVQS